MSRSQLVTICQKKIAGIRGGWVGCRHMACGTFKNCNTYFRSKSGVKITIHFFVRGGEKKVFVSLLFTNRRMLFFFSKLHYLHLSLL